MTQTAAAQHHHHDHRSRPPKALLAACGALIVFALVGTTIVRVTGIGDNRDLGGVAVSSISLTFADEPDGGVTAHNADTGELVRRWAPETGGFVRTTMRALARTRTMSGIGPELPFTLSRTDKGRLLLEDPSTGERVSLEAFGASNEGEFATLLNEEGVF